jgi:hypothetical protein
MVKGLELRIASAMELLQMYKKERDEIQGLGSSPADFQLERILMEFSGKA